MAQGIWSMSSGPGLRIYSAINEAVMDAFIKVLRAHFDAKSDFPVVVSSEFEKIGSWKDRNQVKSARIYCCMPDDPESWTQEEDVNFELSKYDLVRMTPSKSGKTVAVVVGSGSDQLPPVTKRLSMSASDLDLARFSMDVAFEVICRHVIDKSPVLNG